MGNMSYCRFRNTLEALQDCVDTVEDFGWDETSLSPGEKKAMKELHDLARYFANHSEGIVEYCEDQVV